MTSETMIEEVISDLQHNVLIRQWTDDGVLIDEPVARLSLEVLS